MTTIFDCETELGRIATAFPAILTHEQCVAYAQTVAFLNRNMLKMEHRCYLRAGDQLPDQPWVKPQMVLEPVLGSTDEVVEFARKAHEEFVAMAKSQIPESSLKELNDERPANGVPDELDS